MKYKNGWLKLYRKIFENPTITRSPEHMVVWLYLLCHATAQPYRAIFNGKEIELKAGQLITGRKVISQCVKSKIAESKVQRVLKDFENAHQIEQQTCNKNRLITVVNWESYQNSEQPNEQLPNTERTSTEHQINNTRTTAEHQPNIKRTSTEQQLNTYKENKEIKEDKESSSEKGFNHMSVEEAWEIMMRRNGQA
ncbi:MAG: hypothetical protein IJV48_05110 [Ruminococcus sp.]|nr:hypothetical protein [Ruminococcus sp.]